MGGAQGRPEVEIVPEQVRLQGRAALYVAAVGEDLMFRFLLEEPEAGFQKAVVSGQADAAIDQTF